MFEGAVKDSEEQYYSGHEPAKDRASIKVEIEIGSG